MAPGADSHSVQSGHFLRLGVPEVQLFCKRGTTERSQRPWPGTVLHALTAAVDLKPPFTHTHTPQFLPDWGIYRPARAPLPNPTVAEEVGNKHITQEAYRGKHLEVFHRIYSTHR